MTNSPIKGYRALSHGEIDLLNSIKTHGEAIQAQIGAVLEAGGDARWAAIAQTQFQQAFMALSRAVARPTTFA